MDINIGQGYKTEERNCTLLSAILGLHVMGGLPSFQLFKHSLKIQSFLAKEGVSVVEL